MATNDRIKALEEALRRIVQWSEAYPWSAWSAAYPRERGFAGKIAREALEGEDG